MPLGPFIYHPDLPIRVVYDPVVTVDIDLDAETPDGISGRPVALGDIVDIAIRGVVIAQIEQHDDYESHRTRLRGKTCRVVEITQNESSPRRKDDADG